jgi:hypothetical protein
VAEFATPREGIDFLATQIVEQTTSENVALSEVAHKMLLW